MNNTALYALTVLIWGSTWYAITFQLGTVHPVLSVCYRFALAAVVLFAYLLTRKTKTLNFTRYEHVFLALQGLLLFSLNYVLFYFATAHLTSGLIAILFSTITLMNIMNQAIIFKIRVKPTVLIGSLLGLCGILLVFWPEVNALDLGDSAVKGIILSILATFCASLGQMVSMHNSRRSIPVLEANTFGMAYGAGFSLLMAFILSAPLTFEMSAAYLGSMVYLAVFGSAVAFGCYLSLMKNIGADKAAYATVLFPLVALSISTVFEGYEWSFISVCGVLLTLIGNVIVMFNKERVRGWPKKHTTQTVRGE